MWDRGDDGFSSVRTLSVFGSQGIVVDSRPRKINTFLTIFRPAPHHLITFLTLSTSLLVSSPDVKPSASPTALLEDDSASCSSVRPTRAVYKTAQTVHVLISIFTLCGDRS